MGAWFEQGGEPRPYDRGVVYEIDWERAAAGWARHADQLRVHGMALSLWMIDAVALQPGDRVLELAAGPGDTGFLASELVLPGGKLICSDSSPAMLEVARARAAAQGVANVEFKALDMDWIDLPTASVEVILCRWGIMLSADPAAALHEWRRVLAPGGRLAAAVWDAPARNPWSTIPSEALAALGYAPPPDRAGPGMYALSDAAKLEDLLLGAGFVQVSVQAVALERRYASVQAWIEESQDVSAMLRAIWEPLSAHDRAATLTEVSRLAAPFTGADGAVRLPGSSLAALAYA